MKNICIILFLILITSCIEQKKGKNKFNSEPIVELNVSNELFNKNSDYSNFIGSVEVVRLETNVNSLIGDMRKIEFQNNKFYILDRSQVLYLFDEKGNYINKLDKKGKGPGEYLEMRDFFVNKDGSVKILSSHTILTYDSNLNFIEQKAVRVRSDNGREINPIRFLPNGDFTFLYTGSFGLRDIIQGKYKALYCVNDKNKIVDEYLPVFSTVTMGHQNFYRSNDLVNYTNTFGNDTIYQIQDSYLIPKVHINFFEKKITEKDMMGNHAIFYNTITEKELCGNLMKIYENNDYLCFNFIKGKHPKQGVYNRKTKEIKVLNVVKSLPFPYIIVDGLIDYSFFTTINPYVLSHVSDDKIISDFIKKFNLSDLKETDNPIIVKFKFKF
jgi:hypothetical protein